MIVVSAVNTDYTYSTDADAIFNQSLAADACATKMLTLYIQYSVNTVKFCQDQFGFELPSVLIVQRRDKFLARHKQFELDHNRFNL